MQRVAWQRLAISVAESPCRAWRGQAHRGTRGRKNCHRGGQGNTSRCISEHRYQANQHPSPHEGRQPETTGDKTTSKAKKATTPTNTHPPHEGTTRDNRRQDQFRGQEGYHTNQHLSPHAGRQLETRRLQRPRRLPRQPTPIPTWRETTGDKGRQDQFRGQEGYHTNQHPSPHEGRQPETTGDKIIAEAKKATTPTNTQGDNWRQDDFRGQEGYHANQHPFWHEGTTGDNRRQDHFRGQEGYHTNQHLSPHAGRQLETRPLQRPRRLPHQPTRRETTGDKTTSEAKKATTPTNTHPHMKGDNRRQRETRPLQRPRRLPHQPTPIPTWRETTGDNGRQDHFRGQEGYHTNQHAGRQLETRRLQRPRRLPCQPTPIPTWRETTGDRETRLLQRPRRLPHQPAPRLPGLSCIENPSSKLFGGKTQEGRKNLHKPFFVVLNRGAKLRAAMV